MKSAVKYSIQGNDNRNSNVFYQEKEHEFKSAVFLRICLSGSSQTKGVKMASSPPQINMNPLTDKERG
jgi:hypothetical protein